MCVDPYSKPMSTGYKSAVRTICPISLGIAAPPDRGRSFSGLMRDIGKGDVLVVVRLDRLARSVSHLLGVIELLEGQGLISDHATI